MEILFEDETSIENGNCFGNWKFFGYGNPTGNGSLARNWKFCWKIDVVLKMEILLNIEDLLEIGISIGK